ncbi:MAG UNVERIFIED_CONTAM: hypothetical protein LVR18_47460 [Planctomycetaceae bacterium]
MTPRGSLAEDEQSTIRLFEAASPSVVWIESQGYERIGPDATAKRELTSGTGVIWTSRGGSLRICMWWKGLFSKELVSWRWSHRTSRCLRWISFGAVSSCDIAVLQIRHLRQAAAGKVWVRRMI